MDQWRCGECGALNDRVLDVCWHCGDEREYALSAKQGRAIARRLNGLEVENRALSAMLTASTLFVARTGRLLKEAWEEVKVWQDLHATSFDDAAQLAREVERLRGLLERLVELAGVDMKAEEGEIAEAGILMLIQLADDAQEALGDD